LLVLRFDGLPVASLPANLLAGPAAGPVMMWGLTGGLLAGVVPSSLAGLLHGPTRVALWWIDSVAAIVPGVPLGRLGGIHIVLLFAAGAFGLRQAARAGRSAAAVLIVVVLLHPGLALLATPAHSQMIDDDSFIWRDTATTVVELGGGSRPQTVLSTLRAANVDQIDLVIVHQSSFANAALIGWMRTHHDIARVWAPQLSMGVGEIVPLDGTELLVDGVMLAVEYVEDNLRVRAMIVD